MVKRGLWIVLLGSVISANALAEEGYQLALKNYREQAGQAFSAERGKALWEKKVYGKSCTKCHNSDITKPGKKHVLFLTFDIAPMALSANPKLFEDPKDADKAFDKRCNQVFRRQCSALEKGDILTYLISQ
jgi:hypothetical protein